MSKGTMTIGDAFGRLFKDYLTAHGGLESWAVWKVVMKSVHGEVLTPSELVVWRTVTGRDRPRAGGYGRVFFAVGRSSGKTTTAALEAAFQALRHARGQRADILLVAQDSRRSAALLEVVRDLLELSPFRKEIEGLAATELRIGHARVLALPSSSASLRGYHGPVVILDELAHLRGAEGKFNDKELIRAAAPCVRPFGGRVIGLSSPLMESGALYEARSAHQGKDSDVLYVAGPTWQFNSTITEEDAKADAGDDQDLLAEYAGLFRSNLRALLDEDVIAALPGDYLSMPPQDGTSYIGFVDMSGAKSDSAVLAVGHLVTKDGTRRAIVDLLDEVRAPFNAEQTVERFAELAKGYRLSQVTGDAYGGALYSQAFDRHRLRYVQAPLDASGLYCSFALSARSGQVTVPNNETLLRQLRWLEERLTPVKTLVRHAGPHDDTANSVAGCVHMILGRRERVTSLNVPVETRPQGGSFRRDSDGQTWASLREDELDLPERGGWGLQKRGQKSPWSW